jgi:hypothetical protein
MTEPHSKLQATGGYNEEDGYSVAICAGDESPFVTISNLERRDLVYLRDLLDCLIWKEEDTDYGSVKGRVQAVLDEYVPLQLVEEAADRAIHALRDIILSQVDFTQDTRGVVRWDVLEPMITRPLED